MPHMNMAMPVIPGKEADARGFAGEIAGPRRAEYSAFQAPSDTSRETWTLQQTPAGTFLLVWFDAGDVQRGLEDLATGDDEFTKWFRAQIRDITGVDLTDPDGAPPIETLLDWSA
jgi:hypothetical protein